MSLYSARVSKFVQDVPDWRRNTPLMEALQILPSGEPDEVREFDRGRLELYRLGNLELGRAIYEPGWRWTEHVRPIAGTELCEVRHVGFVVSGSAHVSMRDGRHFVLSPGTFFAIPPGHDSWVVGEEQYVSIHIAGADSYAAPVAKSPRKRSASASIRPNAAANSTWFE